MHIIWHFAIKYEINVGNPAIRKEKEGLKKKGNLVKKGEKDEV